MIRTASEMKYPINQLFKPDKEKTNKQKKRFFRKRRAHKNVYEEQFFLFCKELFEKISTISNLTWHVSGI